MNKQQEQKEDWFTNVENLKPIRGGRRAANLNSVANNDLRVTNKEAEEKFRADWEVALQSEDPLKDLWHYIIWFDEHFPAGKPHLLYPMLYKICTKFGTATRYQHDERLLKFWILLAENFPERGLAVFDFAYKRGSCNTMAKFYVRWSEVSSPFLHPISYPFRCMRSWVSLGSFRTFDTSSVGRVEWTVFCIYVSDSGNSTKAREMLDFGLQNRATPITVIHEARERLEMRLMFITLQKTQLHDLSDYEERDMDQDDDILATNAPRQQLAKLEGVGEHLEAPMFRIPKGSTGMLQMQQTNINASFEIYEDEPEVSQTLVVAPSSNKTGRIAEEFEDDPEYQVNVIYHIPTYYLGTIWIL